MDEFFLLRHVILIQVSALGGILNYLDIPAVPRICDMSLLVEDTDYEQYKEKTNMNVNYLNIVGVNTFKIHDL